MQEFRLPECILEATGQQKARFGVAPLALHDTSIATELCEELFTPNAPHIQYALSGVEIFANGSGSHHQLRKLSQRLELILAPLRKAGGVYVYSNLRGCDGERLYFDGCACIAVNGQLVAQVRLADRELPSRNLHFPLTNPPPEDAGNAICNARCRSHYCDS